jgi:hypothetical protein
VNAGRSARHSQPENRVGFGRCRRESLALRAFDHSIDAFEREQSIVLRLELAASSNLVE